MANPAEKMPPGDERNAHLSVEELAAAQGVEPATDLDAIAACWPVDDDPDALDEFIREQRRQRREAPAGRPAGR